MGLPAVYAGTTTVFFAIVNAVKLIPYAALGQLNPDNLRIAAMLCLPAIFGVLAGAAAAAHHHAGAVLQHHHLGAAAGLGQAGLGRHERVVGVAMGWRNIVLGEDEIPVSTPIPANSVPIAGC